MSNHRLLHLSEEQLARLQDGEASAFEAQHLESCTQCAGRLRDLAGATATYIEYLDSVCGTERQQAHWRSLDELIADYRNRRSWSAGYRWMVPAMAAALCLLMVATVLWKRSARGSTGASELLVRSSRTEGASNRMIRIRLHGRTLVRPAVLTTETPANNDGDAAHFRALFVEARYSWREPLSARSFQEWRSTLSDKRDSVSVIHAGNNQEYRVTTETKTGVLKSASLFLRQPDLHPTKGDFQFSGEDLLEMDDVAPTPSIVTPPQLRSTEKPLIEAPASPAETLHVLAALNEIGADVGEPIEVGEDSQHSVIVRASGLTPDRQRQVAEVLRSMPRVKLDLNTASARASQPIPQPATPQKSVVNIPRALQQRFETALGGPSGFQEITDRVLDMSGSVVARAHSIEILATTFPPSVESGLSPADHELLQKLRTTHLSEMARLTRQIRSDLDPVLPATNTVSSSPHAPWQVQTSVLVRSAQALDNSVNNLLAGSYSQASGEAMLTDIADEIRRLEQEIEVALK